MKINLGIGSPNGPHFPVADGVVLKAATFDLLYAQITEYRLAHGIDPGDVVRDVANFVCGQWPTYCLPEPGDGPTEEQRRQSMGGRVTAWAAQTQRAMPPGGYSLVDDGEAKARAATCLQCPYNKPWKTNCAPCWAATETLLAQIRRLRNTGPTQPLWGCEVCGHDNRTAVFMPDESFAPKKETLTRLWIGCWLRKL